MRISDWSSAVCSSDLVQLVRAREFAKLEDLQRRKLLLAKSYDEHQTRLRKNLSALDSLSGEERGDLRKLYAAFREILSENMLALKSAHDAADRVVQMLVSGVRQTRGVSGPEAKTGTPVHGYAPYDRNSGGEGKNVP